MAPDSDPPYSDPSIYDTREVPSALPGQPSPREVEFNQPPQHRRSCLTGCLVVLVVLVVAAIALGLFAKHTYDHWVHSDSTTTTTLPAAGAKQVTAVEYGQLLSGHSAALRTDATDVGTQCRNVVSDKSKCQSAIGTFGTELSATKADLAKVKAPAGLSATDAKLRQAVDDGSDGSADVSKGLSGHPLTLIKGLAKVAKAATELKGAENQLNADLGSTTTTVKK